MQVPDQLKLRNVHWSWHEEQHGSNCHGIDWSIHRSVREEWKVSDI